MVDQSLLRQAADLGVTICFADLDGAEGLWVPEERTILVNRGLSDAEVAEVIEHELAHVMIDNQHADLDAGKEVLVGRPLVHGRRRETVALAAALGLVAVVGGTMYGINAARDGSNQVAPNPDGPGLTVPDESGGGARPSLSPSRGPGGEIVYVTVYPSAPTPRGTGPTLDLPSLSATATRPGPTPTATRTTARVPPPPQQPTTTPPPSAQQTSDPPPQVTPTPEPTTVAPTPDETAGEGGGAGGGTGDQGGVGGGTDTGPVGTEPANATVADVSVPPAPDDTATP